MSLKFSHITLLLLCISSRKEQNKDHTVEQPNSIENKIENTEFQFIIDSSDVKGSVVIYDLKKDIFYSNDFDWANQGRLPASTFKIANSIIGLETGVIESDSTIFKWNGEDRWLDIWEQNLALKDAFQYSCVPCYQEVASKINPERMNTYVEKLHYGDLHIDSLNIRNFWLEGTSRINQMQQIAFLKRFYGNKLPISKRTKDIVQKIMIIDTEKNYTLSGKTGLSIRREKFNGWFVGYVEVADNTYFFATNLEPLSSDINMNELSKKRKSITLLALRKMDIIK
ncbi:class D beta-lactamase [Maribacter aquivivus]|uniref:class D beta-lactamase n=1 Tax=Maribacter aquivivus TaxID=228958 RepID=UPI0024954A57|nr:class D beta-lactamase [Maribacter aquivivus]